MTLSDPVGRESNVESRPVRAGGPHPHDTLPRVPLPATGDLIGEDRTIQVNHCRVPSCENFGVPARHEPQKPGPSPDRDPAYKLHSTSKGQIPSLRCKACLDNPPVKSNASVVSEIERLAEAGGLWAADDTASCPNADCKNHDRSVARHGKAAYRKRGPAPSGRGQRYECKACGRLFSVTSPLRLHDRNKRLAADVFSRIANKAPARGADAGARRPAPGPDARDPAGTSQSARRR